MLPHKGYNFRMKTISRMLDALESVGMSFWQWLAAFLGVVYLRFFFETFSSPSAAFPAAPDALTIAHYFLFFLGVFLSLVLVIRIFTQDIQRITKALLFGFPIIWAPPIIDLLISGGKGRMMAYIFSSGQGLWFDFLSWGGSGPLGGITPGIRAEMYAIVFGVGFYVFIKNSGWQRIAKGILSGIAAYLVLLFWLSTPSIVALLVDFFGKLPFSSDAFSVALSVFARSHLGENEIRSVIQVSYPYGVGVLLNSGLGILFYVIDSLLIAGCYFIFGRNEACAVIRNARMSRLIHFLLMIILGFVTAIFTSTGAIFNGWDYLSAFGLVLSYFCAWLFAVGTNDISDTRIDAISNADRPLITGTLSASRISEMNGFFLIWSLLGAFLCGYWAFFLLCVFTAAYYVYSVPPLRLKRFPLLSTFLISIASLAVAMSSFYLVSPNKLISGFPIRLAAAIVIGITLGANFKDMKDQKGDAAEGVSTLPTLFGPIYGGRVVAGFFGLSFILSGAVSGNSEIFAAGVAFGIIAPWLLLMGPHREWKPFSIYLLFVLVVGILLFF